MLRFLGRPGELAFGLFILVMVAIWAVRSLSIVRDLWMLARERRQAAARPPRNPGAESTRRDG
jgi:hypothetical protein